MRPSRNGGGGRRAERFGGDLRWWSILVGAVGIGAATVVPTTAMTGSAAHAAPVTASAVDPSIPAGSWPTFRNGPARNGWNRAESVLGPGTVAGLRSRFGREDVRGYNQASPPIIVGSRAFYVNGMGVLRACRLPGCTYLWHRNLRTAGSTTGSTPVFADGTVYAGSASYRFDAVDAATGTLRWSWTNPSLSDFVGSPTVAGGVVYLTTRDFGVWALDAATGKVRWHATTDPTADLWSSPTVAGGRVFVASNKLYSFDATTGVRRYAVSLPSYTASTVAVSGGTVFVHSGGGLSAYDAATGSRRFSYVVGDSEIHMGSPVVAGSVVYVSAGNALHAVDAATGARRWMSTAYSLAPGRSPALANGVVYAIANAVPGYSVVAVDAADGRALWNAPLPDEWMPTDPVVSQGWLYVNGKFFRGFSR